VGFAGRLLESAMGPGELADLWWKGADGDLEAAVCQVMKRHKGAREKAWEILYKEIFKSLTLGGQEQIHSVLSRIESLGSPDPVTAQLLVTLGMTQGFGGLIDEVAGSTLRENPMCRVLLEFNSRITRKTMPPRAAFAWLLTHWPKDPAVSKYLDMAIRAVLQAATPSGRPWKLKTAEKRRLATIPYIRAAFLEYGRRPSDPPLLQPEDVLNVIEGFITDPERLLTAAMTLQHGALFAKVAGLLSQDPFAFYFFPCPRPARAAPSAPNELGMYLAKAAAYFPSLNGAYAITWAASFPALANETWHSLIVQLEENIPRPHSDNTAAATALAVLALKDRKRFDEIAEVLGEQWQKSTERASDLAYDLDEAEHGQLHGELEILRKEIYGHDA
jgi:hypothetical protein